MKKKKVLIWIILLLVLASGIGLFQRYRINRGVVVYRTTPIEKGEITHTVTATGALNAVVSVQVGSQVSGTILQLMVDFNSPVKAGQVIAQIDPSSFQAKVDQAKANLANSLASISIARANMESVKADIENARAKVLSSKADVEKSKVGVEDAKRILVQNEELYAQRLISKSDSDRVQFNHESAIAQLSASKAQYESAAAALNSTQAKLKVAEAQYQAAVAVAEQARAALKSSELDLNHTTIYSPVDGSVVLRNVDVGQTVAASFQAPTLFIIAKDLTKMQVNASISEADIGKIREGQDASFMVDAYPATNFRGQVVQIRNAPVTLQNVVTYDVVIAVDNPRLELKPGMTANVSIIVDKRDNVLKVPNAALRFLPKTAGRDQPSVARAPDSKEDNSTAFAASYSSSYDAGSVDRIAKLLELTPDQKEKVRTIFKEAEEQFQKLGKNASKREIMAIRKDNKEKIWNILDKDQRIKFDAWIRRLMSEKDSRSSASMEGRKGKLWTLSKQGKPVSVPVTLGIWDEGTTEILSGEVKEGDLVIVGENTSGNSGTSGAKPPSLRMW